MADDDESPGIGTVTSIVLVVAVLLVLLWFNNVGAFPAVKQAFLKIANPEDVTKIMEKELGKEKLEEQKLQENIKKISEVFIKQINEKDTDCVKEINLNEIQSMEDFSVRFRKNGFDVIKGNELDPLWVEPFVLNQQVSYIKEGIESNEEGFSITDGFSKINNKISLSNFLYKGKEKIYFLDPSASAEFSGKYSKVFAKKVCSESALKKEFVSGVSGDILLKDYLDLDFNYFEEPYKLQDLIVHLILLKEKSSNIEIIGMYNTAYNLWIRLTTEYLVKDYENPGNCLRLNVKKGDKTGFSYGFKDNIFLGKKISEASINLVDGGIISLELFQSSQAGCRKA